MKNPIKHFGFDAKNYKWLLVGLVINMIGYILMIGGNSEDPNVFNEDDLFSTTRITIAPILIVSGFVIILWGIMKKGATESEELEKPMADATAEKPKKK